MAESGDESPGLSGAGWSLWEHLFLTEGGHRYPLKPRAWYRRPWVSAVVVIAFVVVVGALLIIPVSATGTLSYCSSCKAMRPAETTWAVSSHKDVQCTSCHIPPGFVAQANWRMNEAKNIWASYLGVERAADKGHLPGNSNCLKCHPLQKIPNEKDGVRMSHEVHIKLRNLVCADCHDYVSHKKSGQLAGVTMQLCPMCHNEQGAPDRCDFCHVAPPQNVHQPNYLKDHGREARLNEAECLRCHHDKKAFCDPCHAFPPAPHFSGTWRYNHGAAAGKDGTNCKACHGEAYCAQCHSVSHPSDWDTLHGPISAKGPSACLVCHPQGMCDACHKQRGVKL